MWTNDFSLYLITDRHIFPTCCSLYFAIETALEAGVRCIQLRDKGLTTGELLDMATWMRDLTSEFGAKLFINDRVDIALAVGADGVHLGQQSIPAHAARDISGNTLMIGVSTHSIDEAVGAEKNGADFITLGPIYETPSKIQYGRPLGIEILRAVSGRVSIPVFAIGGIKPAMVGEVREAGADGIALISGIFSSENIEGTTKEFLRLLK